MTAMQRELRPDPLTWTEIPWPGPIRTPTASAWTLGPIMVLSELVIAEYPDGSGNGPQWLVSVSASGKRAKPKQLRRALRAFGMVGAEQDNHHPGNVRSYWRPVEESKRVDCQCKVDETIVVDEADGYTWTNPVDGPCRGCELEQLMGMSCPLHPPG
jgi:hypothetical protein